jgi:threonylcarbamoyladenosine tRNA methylthiotransferase MtaB
MAFADAHVFTYSARPGTAAAAMPHQVHNATRKERNAEIQAVVAESAGNYRRAFLGQQLDVLWESSAPDGGGQWRLSGLTDNYLRVEAVAARPLDNHITPALLEQQTDGGLVGRVAAANLESAAIWFEGA